MRIKESDNQISFHFIENEGLFDMGYQILSQEGIEQLLPFRRKHFGRREQIIYDIKGDNIIKLDELLPSMGRDDIVDVVKELVFLIDKIEENGLLQRECLWYKYDDIYYDTNTNHVKVAILPFFEYEDDSKDGEWYDDLEDSVDRIVAFLSEKSAGKVKMVIDMIVSDSIKLEDAITEIDKVGGSESTILLEKLDADGEKQLKLIYLGNKKEVVIVVDKEEFVIGRDSRRLEVDANLPDELSRSISRKHCRIKNINNKFFVQDLNSLNHTLVNGVLIPPMELMELENNDILTMADLEFRVKINDIGG